MAKHTKEEKELIKSIEKLGSIMTPEKFTLMVREQTLDNDRRALHEKEFIETEKESKGSDTVIIEEVMEENEKKPKKSTSKGK